MVAKTDPNALGRVRLETRRVADLVPAGYNPRTISPEALAGLGESIGRFGLVQPIIVNARTGRVVGGHQRLKVLEANGVEATDVVVIDVPEAEEKALNLALNSPRISGEWTADALAELSAQGVGRGFYYAGPTYICGYPSAASGAKINNLWQHGFCGRATAYTKGEDGIVHSEEYQYRVNVPNQFQRSAGWCDTTIRISEKPKPSIGLINYFPPAGGSPPKSSCVPGNANRPSQMPLVDIEIEVPVREDEAAYFAEPPDVNGRPAFHGSAFSDDPATWDGAGEPYDDDWRVTQTYIVDDPDFVDTAQEAGLRKAAKAILDVKSQKQYLFEVGIASPWKAAPPDAPEAASTARWAGMSKRITLSSALRTTQFESATELQVFKVTWDVLGNKTVLEAGTASGWMAFEGIDISKAFSEARVLKKAARMIKDVEDFRNCLLTKPEDRIGGMPKGPVDACDVTIINEQVRRVVSVEKDDEDEVMNITHQALRTWLDEELSIGPHADNPGTNIAVPGRDGLAARQAIDGPVLRSHANPDIPFQGPAPGDNG